MQMIKFIILFIIEKSINRKIKIIMKDNNIVNWEFLDIWN